MKDLVYPHERTLGALTLVLGIITWLLLIVGTVGIALLFVLLGFVLYLFAQSALISYIKGNGVELTEAQFPDLYAQFVDCCEKLQIKKRPQAYILNGDGGLNAFATRFLGREFIVLLTNVVDAMDKHEDGVRFYIGHELGHLRMKHLTGHLLRWPVLWLPLLGAAYSRSQESTCDRHGLACSSSAENGVRAMAALAAGVERWKSIDIAAYLQQVKQTTGFWISFHELLSGYPWLCKRAARIMESPIPKRNGFAYLLAMFIPYAGRLGAGFGALIMIYIIAVLAAIAVPSYMDYTAKAGFASAKVESAPVRDALVRYYNEKQELPASLADIGMEEQLANGNQLQLDPENMVLYVATEHGELVFTPLLNESGEIIWKCEGGEGAKQTQLPQDCRDQ